MDNVAAPSSDTLWTLLGGAVMAIFGGAAGGWMRDKVRSAVLQNRIDMFVKQYHLDRARDSIENDRRHKDNQEEIKENRRVTERVAETVGELNRYLRNGWREKGH